MVQGTGRAVSILAGAIEKTGKYTHSIKVGIDGVQVPLKVRLVCGTRILDEAEYGDDAVLELNERLIGEGPARIQAVAIYADGMEVASPPLNIAIAYAQ